jgi:hypothetical protein
MEAAMASIGIELGGVYANASEVFAREVVAITNDEVTYHDYALLDGAPIGRCCRCSLLAFKRWAARPLAPTEIGALRRDEGAAREKAMAEAMIRSALAAASDEAIRREFYRRGLNRVPKGDQVAKGRQDD